MCEGKSWRHICGHIIKLITHYCATSTKKGWLIRRRVPCPGAMYIPVYDDSTNNLCQSCLEMHLRRQKTRSKQLATKKSEVPQSSFPGYSTPDEHSKAELKRRIRPLPETTSSSVFAEPRDLPKANTPRPIKPPAPLQRRHATRRPVIEDCYGNKPASERKTREGSRRPAVQKDDGRRIRPYPENHPPVNMDVVPAQIKVQGESRNRTARPGERAWVPGTHYESERMAARERVPCDAESLYLGHSSQTRKQAPVGEDSWPRAVDDHRTYRRENTPAYRPNPMFASRNPQPPLFPAKTGPSRSSRTQDHKTRHHEVAPGQKRSHNPHGQKDRVDSNEGSLDRLLTKTKTLKDSGCKTTGAAFKKLLFNSPPSPTDTVFSFACVDSHAIASGHKQLLGGG